MARTADLLGDRWTPLILRELLMGQHRFNELQQRLDINRSVLSQRLGVLEEAGIIERHIYHEHPPRVEYVPTEKGLALWDVLGVMWAYGEAWLTDEPLPVELVDQRTGRPVHPMVIDSMTGESLEVSTTRRRVRQ